MLASGVAVFSTAHQSAEHYFLDMCFARVQEAVDQTSSSDHASLALGSALELLFSLTTELTMASYIYYLLYYVTIQSRNYFLLYKIREDNNSSKMVIFLFQLAHVTPIS